MALDHSIEAQQDYDQSRRATAYPPPDLQIPSFRAVARRAVHRTRHFIRSLGSERNQKQPSSSSASHTLTHTHTHTPDNNNNNNNHHRQKQPANPQSQSVFFALPLEVRNEIYSQVLGDSNIHIHFRGTSLRHHRCKCASCPGIAHFYEYNRAWKRSWACDGSEYTLDGNQVSAGLLWTCRRIYEEALGYLYQENIFTFKGLLGLWGFLGPYRSTAANGINEVHLDLPLRADRDARKDDEDLGVVDSAWEMLASLESLRILEIRLHQLWIPGLTVDETGSLPGLELYYKVSLDRLREPFEKLWEKKGMQVVRVYVPRGMLQYCEQWLMGEPFEVRGMDEWPWDGTTTTARRIPLEVF